VRRQLQISAPIDAGLIYLSGVQVNGGSPYAVLRLHYAQHSGLCFAAPSATSLCRMECG
jgi:hypothetical protein